MRNVFAVDPGTDRTAWISMNENGEILEHDITPNAKMLDVIDRLGGEGKKMAIEMMASMGMAVGQTVFETAVWIGRFVQRWLDHGGDYELVYRVDEKMHLCGNPRAKDPNIRQAIMDAYGKDPVGNKRNPGPLYGISKDEWSAIAVAKVSLEAPVEQRTNKRSKL